MVGYLIIIQQSTAIIASLQVHHDGLISTISNNHTHPYRKPGGSVGRLYSTVEPVGGRGFYGTSLAMLRRLNYPCNDIRSVLHFSVIDTAPTPT